MKKKVLVLCLLMISLVTLAGCKSKSEVTRVTLSVNPEIEFILNEKGIITSVTGLNNEGKMIVLDEEITGKTIEEGINIVLEIESEMGYLIATNEEIDIKFSVSSDTLKKNIKNSIDSFIEENDIEAKITELKALTKAEIETILAAADETIKAANLSYEEMLIKLDEYRNETKDLVTTELVDLYNQFKNTEINFMEYEFTSELVNSLDEAYQLVISGFDAFYTGIETAKKSIKEMEYNLFIKEDSLYQTSYQSLLEYKKEILELKKEIDAMDDTNSLKAIKQGELTVKTNLYNSAVTNMESSKGLALSSLEGAYQVLETAKTSLESFVATLPTEIKTMINENLKEQQTKMNELKDKLFETFETEYLSEIEKAYNEALEYKNSLKNK